MTPAERYRLADLRLRVARAQLLLEVAAADRDPPLADLLTFAKQLGDGDEFAVDSVAAFRAAITSELQTAEAELLLFG
ncbi:MAG TPA: hypothetical protein VGR01_19700 [Burkholderiales bacterium]|jgi:hypothetical protein|nr:hypothetical protein [Burkholderiales bacterium]